MTLGHYRRALVIVMFIVLIKEELRAIINSSEIQLDDHIISSSKGCRFGHKKCAYFYPSSPNFQVFLWHGGPLAYIFSQQALR